MAYNIESRNILERFAGMPTEEIKRRKQVFNFTMACVNIERNINVGALLRTAECMGASAFAILGRRKWDRRAAVGSQNYLGITYCANATEFYNWLIKENHTLICVDKTINSQPIESYLYPKSPCFLFGSEADGIPSEYYQLSNLPPLHIPQFGALRSLNVGIAGGIVAHDYVTRLNKGVQV